MSYLTPISWARKYFADDSRPSETTVRKWLREGHVPARKIGGSWFVDEHKWLAANDPLVERVLKAG